MTSMASESVSTILVSCKQTRFHIESPNYRELDIEGLNITVTSADANASAGSGKGKAKAKAARGEGTEILSNATLRLKAGQRYALVGRNGSGKSTLLKAIAEKLIPGIPEATRISILQQTDASDANLDEAPPEQAAAGGSSAGGRTVLEEVVEKATAKDELEREIEALSRGVNSSDAHNALRALRRLRHERLQKRLFVLDKDARLRSGARGLQARKALTAFEKTVAESAARLEEKDEDISPETLAAETHEAADALAELQARAEPARLARVEARARRVLTGLGFADEAALQRPAAGLSGGWRMRAALAAALLSPADLLVLDEPTNFLDLLGIVWLQRFLLSPQVTGDEAEGGGEPQPPTLILVSHDRAFLAAACTDLLILRDKALTAYHGDLASYEAARAEQRVHQRRAREAQDRQKAHIQETITRNMREGRKAGDDTRVRQAKMRQRKLDDRWGVETNARGHRFRLNKDLEGFHLTSRAALEAPTAERGVSVVLPDPADDLRFPGPLVSLEGVTFRYPAAKGSKGKAVAPAKNALEDVSLTVHVGDRIGVLGLNGAGKSTLIRLLVGDAAGDAACRPTRGTLTTHPRLRLGYYAQHAVEQLQALERAEPGLTALALLQREAGGALNEGELRGLLGSLGLQGRTASDVPLRRLSGGQAVRCALARLLWRRPHLLVLDEVTTHLDYETVAALRSALRSWPGAVVLVSHDRWFVRGVVEGEADDTGGDDDSDSDGECSDSDGGGGAGGSGGGGGAPRRRLVYRLRAGKMTLLQNGVQEFEDLMEKRVQKLMADG